MSSKSRASAELGRLFQMRDATDEEEQVPVRRPRKKKKPAAVAKVAPTVTKDASVRDPLPVGRGRGRPRDGKRSDEQFMGTTVFLKVETLRDVDMELLLMRYGSEKKDRSELIEELLVQWLRSRS